MERKSLADTRAIFRLRTEMIDVKDNMRGKYKGDGENCEACDSHVPESQNHVMSCPGYRELRIGRDMGSTATKGEKKAYEVNKV